MMRDFPIMGEFKGSAGEVQTYLLFKLTSQCFLIRQYQVRGETAGTFIKIE
jgi:hypothetical protein